MKRYVLFLFVLIAIVLSAACSAVGTAATSTRATSSSAATRTPAALSATPSSARQSTPTVGGATATTEPNADISPSGDIPDNATFLTYRAAKYSLQYVEGWAREQLANEGTRFADKDSFVSVTIQPLPSGAIPNYASTQGVADSSKEFEQFSKTGIKAVKLPAGQAALLTFTGLSVPDPVTSKRVTLDVNRYYIAGSKYLAILTEATPTGVDNVDAFNQIAQSFAWSGQ